MLKQRGVSLIELLIGLAVMGVLLAIAIPNLSAWLQNAQVRTAAESILNGVQIARGEAIRTNSQAKFSLTSTGGMADWSVLADDPTTAGISLTVPVQSWKGAQAKNARVGASTASTQDYTQPLQAGTGLPASVTFDSFGHMVGTGITRIDVTNAAASGARRLVIIISSFGLARLCDPALSLASNPQGCA